MTTSPRIPAKIQVRIAELKQKLAGRDGKPGYKANCDAMRAEIARLEKLT